MSTGYKEFIVKAGEYTGVVKKAQWTKSVWNKTSSNPEGDSLNLWIDLSLPNEKYKRVFDTIGITDLKRINEVRKLAGLNEYGEKNLLKKDPSDLEGCSVTLLVDRYTSKAGKTSNIILSYCGNQKFEEGDSDDSIPF